MPLRISESLSCSFCSRSQSKVKKLIAGSGVYICDECALGFLSLPKEAIPANAQNESCSFCGKRAREVETVFRQESARICNECLEICREIILCDTEMAGA